MKDQEPRQCLESRMIEQNCVIDHLGPAVSRETFKATPWGQESQLSPTGDIGNEDFPKKGKGSRRS